MEILSNDIYFGSWRSSLVPISISSLFVIAEIMFESNLLLLDVVLFAANYQWSKEYLMCQSLYSQMKRATDQWFYLSYIHVTFWSGSTKPCDYKLVVITT